jgi:hypothetical protein
MTKNEKKLCITFFWIFVGTISALLFFSTLDRINNANDTVSRYAKSLASLPPENTDILNLEQRVNSLKEKNIDKKAEAPSAIEDITAGIRKNLLKHGIRPTRYAINGKDETESVDFFIHCEPNQFLSFLDTNSSPGKGFFYSRLSVKPSTGDNFIDVMIRIEHE